MERYIEKTLPDKLHVIDIAEPIAQCIASLCQAKGIVFTYTTTAPSSTTTPKGAWARFKQWRKQKLCPYFSFSVLLTLKYLFHWWRTVRRHFPAKPTLQKKHGVLLGTWFPNIDQNPAQEGHFRSRYWEAAHDVLDDVLAYKHWFFIYADTPQKITEHVALRDVFVKNGLSADMVFCEECISLFGMARAFKNWFSVAWRSRSLSHCLQNAFQWPSSSLNVYTLLKDMWLDSTQGNHLLRHLLIFEGIRSYCKAVGPQDMVITSAELQYWERFLFKFQRDMGCQRVYAAQHSVVREADFRFFSASEAWSVPEFVAQMPDRFFANGKAAYNTMRKGHFPENRLGMLEAVRFMYLANVKTFPPGPPRRLLLVTSYFEKETKAMLKCLAKAMAASDLALWQNCCIKPHPFLPVDRWVQEYFIHPPAVVSGRIEDYLLEGTIVFSDAATSVSLLALYRGLPLVVFEAENTFNMGSLPDMDALPVAKDAASLLVALQSSEQLPFDSEYFCLDAELPRWKDLFTA